MAGLIACEDTAVPLVDQQSGLVRPGALRIRLNRALGGYSPVLRWYRRNRPAWLWALTSPLGRVTLRYVDQHGLRVRRGVLKDATFPPVSVAHAGFVPAKLLGCYEQEIQGAIARSVQFAPDTVVNIGSGDGYFTVALARLHPAARVVGYETDERERESARALAALNGVSIELRGTCGPADLERIGDRPLLLIDVEGYELHLLDACALPSLRRATMIVELHDRGGGTMIATTLRSRFAPTHRITVIEGQPRHFRDFPELDGWDAQEAAVAVSEGRPHAGRWMVFEPRDTGIDSAINSPTVT
jgi:hypothetical protein